MIIKPKKPYLVSVEEQMEDQEIRIRNADMLVDATSMQEACNKVEEYFGMGIKLTITQCKLMG